MSAPRTRAAEREQPVGAGWLARPQLDAATLRSLPLFASLDDAQAARVLARLREQTAAAGETVVGQFQPGRDLYVVLEGSVRVEADDSEIAVLVAGEFFGEMAVIDWGGGFGRSRSATVKARVPSRLAVLDWELATWLMDAAPEVSRQLREAARGRAVARVVSPPA